MTRKTTIVTILLMTIVSISSNSQSKLQSKSDPKALSTLEKISKNLKKDSYEVDINVAIYKGISDNKKEEEEKIKLKTHNGKFFLQTREMDIYFDGKTQWIHNKNEKEVTISTVDADALKNILPADLDDLDKKYRIVYEQNDADNVIITLLPNNKQDVIFRVRMFLNKKQDQILKIENSLRNGYRIIATFDEMKKVKLPEATFSFDVKQHKDIRINDMR